MATSVIAVTESFGRLSLDSDTDSFLSIGVLVVSLTNYCFFGTESS